MEEIKFDEDGISYDCPLYGEITIQECYACYFNAGVLDDFSEACILLNSVSWVQLPHRIF